LKVTGVWQSLHFDMDLTNITKFTLLINMTAVVQEPPKVTNEDVIMTVNPYPN
ncbi:31873_t:CDS:1, partial [Racocetra persica]